MVGLKAVWELRPHRVGFHASRRVRRRRWFGGASGGREPIIWRATADRQRHKRHHQGINIVLKSGTQVAAGMDGIIRVQAINCQIT
jgi:murein DD-endopeptidase MepM/ murein hydrolase activator NlpD